MTELIWDGKYDEQERKVAPPRIALPFQTVERVNESAADRHRMQNLFASGCDTKWRNRLIWGDKKYVLPSLREFAGQVNVVYIDPPFATGGDFSDTATLPDAAETDGNGTVTNARGVGLPPGRGTHADGAPVYARKCAACHGARGEGTGTGASALPRLVGKEPRAGFPFGQSLAHVKTIGNYWPYATTGYDYVRRAMPLDAPGSLTPDELYAVTAFLLAENGVIAHDATMDAHTAAGPHARVRSVRDRRPRQAAGVPLRSTRRAASPSLDQDMKPTMRAGIVLAGQGTP
jgi:cytochrome c